MKKTMTALLASCCFAILTACATPIKANGGVDVDMPPVPVKKTLMESDVASYIEDVRSTALQCKANFAVN